MKIALVYTKIHPDQGGPWVSFDPSGAPSREDATPTPGPCLLKRRRQAASTQQSSRVRHPPGSFSAVTCTAASEERICRSVNYFEVSPRPVPFSALSLAVAGQTTARARRARRPPGATAVPTRTAECLAEAEPTVGEENGPERAFAVVAPDRGRGLDFSLQSRPRGGYS